MADPECERGGGVSHILAEKGVLASLYSKKGMKMYYFHQEGGGVRRVRPMLDPPLSSTVLGNADIKETLLPFCELTDMSSHVIPKRTIHKIN